MRERECGIKEDFDWSKKHKMLLSANTADVAYTLTINPMNRVINVSSEAFEGHLYEKEAYRATSSVMVFLWLDRPAIPNKRR